MARKIFDTHFHIGKWGKRKVFTCEVQPLLKEHENYKDCEIYLQENNIDKGIVVPTYLTEEPKAGLVDYNGLVLEAVDKVDNIYGGLWVSPMPADMRYTEKILARATHSKIKVLKMSVNAWGPYTYSPKSWDKTFRYNIECILEFSKQHNLVTQLHTGVSDSRAFSEFLCQYKWIGRVQFVHMGETVEGVLEFVPRFVRWIKDNFDFYCDIALVPGFALGWIVSRLEKIEGGLNRVLFGTDAPWSSFLSHYWKVESLDIDESLKSKIFWDNAEKLYGK